MDRREKARQIALKQYEEINKAIEHEAKKGDGIYIPPSVPERVIDAMQEHTKQTLNELRERVNNIDKDSKFSSLVFKKDVLDLIDQLNE